VASLILRPLGASKPVVCSFVADDAIAPLARLGMVVRLCWSSWYWWGFWIMVLASDCPIVASVVDLGGLDGSV